VKLLIIIIIYIYIYLFKNNVGEEPRSSVCYHSLDKSMELAIARYYVEDNFSLYKKQYAEKVIEYIKQSMINRIPEMEWLDDETIEYAYKKVAAMKEMIGYQDYIMDPKYIYEKYEKMEFSHDDYLNNIVNFIAFKNAEEIKYLNYSINEIPQPDMTPHVNRLKFLLIILLIY